MDHLTIFCVSVRARCARRTVAEARPLRLEDDMGAYARRYVCDDSGGERLFLRCDYDTPLRLLYAPTKCNAMHNGREERSVGHVSIYFRGYAMLCSLSRMRLPSSRLLRSRKRRRLLPEWSRMEESKLCRLNMIMMFVIVVGSSKVVAEVGIVVMPAKQIKKQESNKMPPSACNPRARNRITNEWKTLGAQCHSITSSPNSPSSAGTS